ncbi:hypothetical protein BO78DRAFT_373732 [Aspergillus sclerotiicarbonarius CBS 121057]|uniref:Helix-turn-helix domain-containing protein n=1 Tax=Aspergillus sclerotiicarbonarius (strain CBS 121057 / IBT 28362) TaxID=1448318 RepID=A0A319ESQ6_ASPSB|nr:hypothetical protein BO78DRAFT_373732 [Aspergillus sclerotiicarbonarius CBS 121057]
MGASSSKPVRSAAQAARRQYPKQPVSPPTSAPRQQQPPSKPAKQPQPQTPSPSPRPPRPSQPQGPTYHSKEPPSLQRSSAIDLDGRDPDFAASLRTIGPVTPNPTYSPSSTFSQQPAPTVFPPASNPALLVFSARQRITKAAEQEAEAMGKMDFAGREFLDALTVRQVLAMRDRQGLGEAEIERMLRLKGGVVGRLGGRGVVGDIG